MDRSVYVDGVAIGAEHLNYTEQTKIEAIKRIVTLSGTTGPVKGLIVAPDPNNLYQVMISQGEGWTFGGEYVKLDSDVHGIGVSNVIGVDSYVTLKVTETSILSLPHEITGEMYDTKIRSETVVEVLSKDDWLALSDRSNYVLLAIVRGSGSIVRGVDILRPLSTNVVLLAALRQTWALTGVRVVVISSNTSLGEGSLMWTVDDKKLRWRAPGDFDYGNPVYVGVSGLYQLFAADGIKYVKVEVIVEDLPGSDLEESVQVVNILEQGELSPGSMADGLHRALLGSGVLSTKNPHAQTLDDLDPGVQQNIYRHRLYEHDVGILGEPGSLSGRVSIFDSARVYINPVVSGEMLISGGKLYEQLGTSYVSFEGKAGSKYFLYVGEGGVVKAEGYVPLGYLPLASVIWDGSSLSELEDLRVWGDVDPSMKIRIDDVDGEFNPSQKGYVLSDSLGMIRWVLRSVVGGDTWKSLPKYTLVQVGDWLERIANSLDTLSTTFDRHVLLTPFDKVHNIQMGHGGLFDADTVDGCHASDFLEDITKRLGSGHGSGINADMVDGYHWDNIKKYVDGQIDEKMIFMEVLGVPMMLHGTQHTDSSLRVTVGGKDWFVPVVSSTCECTCTCTCTAPCSCTGPCSCTATCTICHLKV